MYFSYIRIKKVNKISEIPDKNRATITIYFIVLAFTFFAISIPTASPANMNGSNTSDFLNISNVRIPSKIYATNRNRLSARNTALNVPLNASSLFEVRPMYAARSAPIPNIPLITPARSPVMISTGIDSFRFVWVTSVYKRSAATITTTIPNTSFSLETSACFKMSEPIKQPVSTMAISGRHVFQEILFLFFHTSTQFGGKPRIKSTGEMKLLLHTKLMIELNTRVFANPQSPFTMYARKVAVADKNMKMIIPNNHCGANNYT